jgi:hypothetical protein
MSKRFLTPISGSTASFTNVVNAASFVGDGSGLTNLPNTITTSSYVAVGKLAADQSITTTTDTLISFVDDIDPQSWWDASTKRFTPNISGYYNIAISVWWSSGTASTNQYNAQIRKNGNTFAIFQNQVVTNTGLSQGGSRIVYLNGSTDYIDFTAYNGDSSSRNIQYGGNGQGTWYTATLLASGGVSNVGVTQIVAGTNITISPTSGSGIVTINSTGGSSTGSAFTNISASGTASVNTLRVYGTSASGSLTTTRDAVINSLTIGTGSSNSTTNTVFGLQAFSSNVTGTSNVAIGDRALFSSSTGGSNVAVGAQALFNGYQALLANISGISNIAIGTQALQTTSATHNIAIGTTALSNSTTGGRNIGIGFNAGAGITTGSNNIAIGYLAYNSGGGEGENNVVIGANAGTAITTASGNTLLGYGAGRLLNSGSWNVIIGNNSGTSIADSTNNIILSDGAGNIVLTASGISKAVNIPGSLTASVLVGDGSVPSTGSTGQVLIKSSSATYSGSWSNPSFGFLPLVSNNYYMSQKGTTTGLNGTASTLFFSPIFIPNSVTINQMSFYATTITTSGSIRLGIYNDLNGSPSTLVLDAGLVAFTVALANSVTVSKVLTPGWYWLCGVLISGNATFFGYSPTGNMHEQRRGTVIGQNPHAFWSASFNSASLPGNVTGSVTSSSAGGFCVMVRAA